MITTFNHGPVHGFRLGRTLLGKGRYFTACFHLDGLLIDSGCAHTGPELAAALAESPLHTVAHTHSHEDHWGHSAQLQAQRGVRVFSPEPTLDLVRGQADPPRLMPYQKVLWGPPAPCPGAEPLPEALETPRHRLTVIPTPGHSPDHVCFFEEEQGWLFVGDAYTGGRDRALRRGYDIWGIIASLRTMAALNPTVLFCGSGSVVEDPAAALRDKISYLVVRGQYVLELRRRGWPPKLIARSIFGREPAISYITQGDFSTVNLVLSYLADSPHRPA
ncbi:MAG: MBL fold metallo-hydrolase [Desulfarculus sp.]|nr:MBL fold metallo-hydrolase [Desulfarculus sp.]